MLFDVQRQREGRHAWFRSARRDSAAAPARRGRSCRCAADAATCTQSSNRMKRNRIDVEVPGLKSAAPDIVRRIGIDQMHDGPEQAVRSQAVAISALIRSSSVRSTSRVSACVEIGRHRRVVLPSHHRRASVAHDPSMSGLTPLIEPSIGPGSDVCLNPACGGSASPRSSWPAASRPAARSHHIADSAASRPSA